MTRSELKALRFGELYGQQNWNGVRAMSMLHHFGGIAMLSTGLCEKAKEFDFKTTETFKDMARGEQLPPASIPLCETCVLMLGIARANGISDYHPRIIELVHAVMSKADK